MDSENVKASEAMARKLADVEAALQRAKEEAGRATKEAEQARADAQVARELKAQAERKLADVEATRMAAEGREKACQSAPKTQSGFGARFRSWFRPRPPDAKLLLNKRIR